MEVFHYLDVKGQPAGEGTKGVTVRWLITKEMGAKNFAMRLFEVDVGGYSPLHSHLWEHEVFILEGEGEVVGEESPMRLIAGDVIYIPPNEKHQLRNTGESKLKFLCLIPYIKE